MNDNREAVSAALEAWYGTLGTLIHHLTEADEDASSEAILILLLQGLGSFGGPDSVMGHFFPVLDAIKKKVDASDLAGALSQAQLFRHQIEVVRALVSTEAGA